MIKKLKLFFKFSLLLFSINSIAISQIQVGDTLQFWSVSYIDWQPDTVINQRLISAVCKKVGVNCYVFTESTLGNTPSQQTINTLAGIFDTSYSIRLPQIYGPVPNEFDNDPRVFILIVQPEGGWTGYLDPAHQMPDTMVYRIWQKHSSEREIIYISTTAFTYNLHLSTLAHELGHLILWGRDHSPEPPGNPVKYWEDDWINEAFATFAPVYLNENLSAPNIYDPGAFFTVNPDLSLIYFISGYSYNQVKLWLVFMYEHYGGFNFISKLINEQANGIQGVINALEDLNYNESFDDTFEHWVTANYLDNMQFMNGKYGYYHYNFQGCHHTYVHNSYPVIQKIDSVSSYAVDYISFVTAVSIPLTISFSCDTTSKFRLTFMLLSTQNPNQINIINSTIDSCGLANFNASGFGSSYNKIVMMVINIDSSLGDSSSSQYKYSAVPANFISPGVESEIFHFNLCQNYPNPFNSSTTIKFQIPQLSVNGTSEKIVKLIVYDVLGREVALLINENLKPGNYKTDFPPAGYEKKYPSGIYFYKLTVGEYMDTKKLILLK